LTVTILYSKFHAEDFFFQLGIGKKMINCFVHETNCLSVIFTLFSDVYVAHDDMMRLGAISGNKRRDDDACMSVSVYDTLNL
jgi:hypothetical protein